MKWFIKKIVAGILIQMFQLEIDGKKIAAFLFYQQKSLILWSWIDVINLSVNECHRNMIKF